MGATGFDYSSAAAIAADMGAKGAHLRLRRGTAPAAATDPSQRRTHFRGHCLEDTVRGLCDLTATEPAALSAAVGG